MDKEAGAGVLIKSAEALKRLEKVDTLVVNKTGTLDGGKPKVTTVVAICTPKVDLPGLAASLERSSANGASGPRPARR